MSPLAEARGGGAGGFGGPGFQFRIGRVVHGPDGEVFLMKDLAGHQEEAFEALTDEGFPEAADQVELVAEGGGRGDCRFAQQVEQRDRAAFIERNQRAGGEVVR